MPILPLLKKYWLYIILVITVATGCWYLWKPAPPVQEVYHAAVKQDDGSTVVEVKPDASAKPAHMLPKGATLERKVQIVVQPKPLTPPPTIKGCEDSVTQCPPTTVDLSLVRLPDDTKRVVASSPNGEILSAIDVPVEAAKPVPQEKVWAAGITYNPFRRVGGVTVERDFGWIRVGADLTQHTEGAIPADPFVRAMVRF